MYVPRSGKYTPVIDGIVPTRMLIDDDSLSIVEVSLSKDWHHLTLIYAYTYKNELSSEKMKGDFEDKRNRSFIFFGLEVYPYAFQQGLWFPKVGTTKLATIVVCTKGYSRTHAPTKFAIYSNVCKLYNATFFLFYYLCIR